MPSVTIGFRGLLVFHYMNDVMEIGVLNAQAHQGSAATPHTIHVPRIIKTKDGVIASIFDLRTRPELGNVRNWEIEVTHPLQDTVTKFQHGRNFNRRTHPALRDYRWIADLEADDLHNKDLKNDLDMSKLIMVLNVRHAEFYTHQLSKPLMRKSVVPPGPSVFYGRAAEVTACRIDLDQGEVLLKADTDEIFRFNERTEDGVVYEFSNAPADVDPHEPYAENGEGHFSMYYSHLFKPQQAAQPAQPSPPLRPQFNLVPQDDPTPSPDPALCGASGLGKRQDPLNP
jgi:hypothetical protein